MIMPVYLERYNALVRKGISASVQGVCFGAVPLVTGLNQLEATYWCAPAQVWY